MRVDARLDSKSNGLPHTTSCSVCLLVNALIIQETFVT
jgi:hypothetical protein